MLMENPTPTSTTCLIVPYGKPQRLSDPGKDFAPEELEKLLQKGLGNDTLFNYWDECLARCGLL